MQFSIKALFFWLTVVCLLLGLFHRPLAIMYDNLDINHICFRQPFLHLAWLTGADVNYHLNSTEPPHKLMRFLGLSLSMMLHISVIYFGLLGLAFLYRWAACDLSPKRNIEILRGNLAESCPAPIIFLSIGLILIFVLAVVL